jgi:hypothetical protein
VVIQNAPLHLLRKSVWLAKVSPRTQMVQKEEVAAKGERQVPKDRTERMDE